MADGLELNAGSGGATLATDDAGAAGHVQVVKLAVSTDGSATALTADNTNGLLADVKRVQGNVTTVGAAADGAALAGNPVLVAGSDGTNAQSISVTSGGLVQVHDGGGTLSVDDGGSTVSIDDGGGVITVDGTVAVTHAALTELGGAINASAQMDVNVAAGTVAVTHAALTELAAAIDTEVQVDVVGALPAGDNNIGNVDLASAIPAGTNNIGDVDVASIAAGDNVIGRVKLSDGTDVADILDLTNANPLAVAILDGDGSQITSFGGGTQYTEDAAAAANPVGTATILVRADAPAGVTTTDGDNVAQRGTDYGAAYVQVVDSAGNFVDTFGGSGGTAAADDADFTAGTTQGTPAMGVYESTPSSVTDGDLGVVGITQTRALRTAVEGTVTVGSHAVTNAGTFAVQVDGEALTALQVIDNPVLVDDAAFTPATSSVMMAGFEADESSTDSVDEGDAGAARMTLTRKLIVTPQPHTAGGCTPFYNIDVDESEDAIKASPGQLYELYLFNATAAPLYVKLYDATVANVTVGTTTPVMTIPVPANADSDGAGVVRNWPNGLAFANAITIAATTAAADNDTGAPAANAVMASGAYA